VRTQNARLVTLAALAPEWWGQVHQLNVKPVGSYYIDLPGQLPREPEPATHQLSAESLARCRQVFEDMTEEEARGLYRPMSDRRFDQTTAQLVNVDAVLYRMPQGSSAIMWIKYGELLWPVALIRGAPLTKVPPPDVDRIREWNITAQPTNSLTTARTESMKKTYSGCTRDSSHNDAKAAADIAKGFSKLSTPKHPDHGK
jgi:hypothetical protein